MCVFGPALSSNFFLFFFEGGSSAAILFGLCWTVFNQLQRFPTTPSGVHRKVHPKIEWINPPKEKRSRSVPVQQRVSKQSVGHFGHLEQRTSRVKRPQYRYGLSDSWTGILEVDGYASGVHAHFQVRLCPTIPDCYKMSQQYGSLGS